MFIWAYAPAASDSRKLLIVTVLTLIAISDAGNNTSIVISRIVM